MIWDGRSLASVIAAKQGSASDPDIAYNIRLLEAETSKEYSIPFTEEWYKIPVISREAMIAASVARKWLDSLQQEDAMNRSMKTNATKH